MLAQSERNSEKQNQELTVQTCRETGQFQTLQPQMQETLLLQQQIAQKDESIQILQQELSQKNEETRRLTAEVSDIKKELVNEKKNVKVEYREKEVHVEKCNGCAMGSMEKAKKQYDVLKASYKIFGAMLAAYSFVVTCFQISRARYFKLCCLRIFNFVRWIVIRIWEWADSIEWFESYVANRFITGIFCASLALVPVLVIVGLYKLYSCTHFCHWGTVAEIVFSFIIIINLDRQLYFQKLNPVLLFFILHIVYLLTMYVVRKRME